MFVLLVFWQNSIAGWFSGPKSPDRTIVKVEKVADGDTVYLTDGRKVRLIGVNAFEINGAADDYARAAKKALRELIENKNVQIQTGLEAKDRYGRILAHLFIDDQNVQEYLLVKGLAVVVAIPPNIEYIEQYKQAELQAKKQKRGIWANQQDWMVDMHTAQGRREANARQGFIYLRGTVKDIGQSRRNYRLALDDKFAVTISKDHFEQFFNLSLDTLRTKTIQVRGWVTQFKGKRYVKIRHAAMLDIED